MECDTVLLGKWFWMFGRIHLQDPAVQGLLNPEDKGTVNYKKVKYLHMFWIDI